MLSRPILRATSGTRRRLLCEALRAIDVVADPAVARLTTALAALKR